MHIFNYLRFKLSKIRLLTYHYSESDLYIQQLAMYSTASSFDVQKENRVLSCNTFRKTMATEFFPYNNLSATQKWPTAFNWSNFDIHVDPHEDHESKFKFNKSSCIGSAGSCFAQRITQSLQSHNFNYLLAEQPPTFLPHSLATEYNYGVYSARYGNVYSARQLLQLFDRAFGEFTPTLGAWKTKNNTFIDPFRPRIQPDGFESEEEVVIDREVHLRKTKDVFTNSDIFIFTLGLTECWIDSRDGAVLPTCPGRGYGNFDESIYKFHNMSFNETYEDLKNALLKIRSLNPTIKIILTISPIPLVATMTSNHIVTANTYSKSILRAVVGQIVQELDYVDYFGSYEILTNCYRNHLYWEGDMRTLNNTALDVVFNSFYKYFGNPHCQVSGYICNEENSDSNTKSLETITIDCDEDEILKHLSRR